MKCLGHVYVKVGICTVDKSRCIEVEGLVDTGATLTTIPRSLADELGIKVVRRDTVETGAGFIEVERGVAIVSIAGRETVTEIWLSDIIGRVLIGVTTLEMLGLRIDPRTGRLEPSPLLLYRFYG
ncbi:conserved hypothetical protein [Ignisphaera aggregans DSM 17230]|uniref:Aspartyl protease n=1 Tax=Ignisphaera aggregans (strain DSM 17230 / JCM 13409 / AQ1.S1) TaxID=583356 RepID=E0STQ5_IGNAA|nr:conserved hypothetical protein [Ignisphaera aggregans DSM 17230]